MTVYCPECGSDACGMWALTADNRLVGPGDRATFECWDCLRVFEAVMPEPVLDDGDAWCGGFADNH
jgi:hypothetical protein